MKPVKVGICGLGTVGGGTFNVLTSNAQEIARRAGREIIVEQIGTRRDNPDCDTGSTAISRDIFDVAKNPEIDVVVELQRRHTNPSKRARSLQEPLYSCPAQTALCFRAFLCSQSFTINAVSGKLTIYQPTTSELMPSHKQ